MENSMKFPQKVKKINLPYDPAILLLGIYWKEIQLIYSVVLFTIAKAWKQPKCPSADEWIKKMWYIYTMEYYSAIKRMK